MKYRKKIARLNGRIYAWEQTQNGNSDIARKHPKGFRKPGSVKK